MFFECCTFNRGLGFFCLFVYLVWLLNSFPRIYFLWEIEFEIFPNKFGKELPGSCKDLR